MESKFATTSAAETIQQKLLEYALKIISRKRYTEKAMREKLEQFFKKLIKSLEKDLLPKEPEEDKNPLDEKQIIENVVARLKELKYLDDVSFARDYIHDRAAFKPRGKFLLKKELTLKGIPAETIDIVLFELNLDESQMAKELLQKYSKKLEKLEEKDRKAKAYRLLASRGFNPDSIYKAVTSCYTNLA